MTLDAYQALAARHDLLPALLVSLRVATVSTVLSAILGFSLAILLRRSGVGWRTALQASLPVPYIVAGLAILWTLSPSGFVARLLIGAGLLAPGDAFPLLVHDAWGLGIVIAYTWKATAFIAMIALAALDGLDDGLEATASTLGAGRMLRVRHILWPRARSSVFAAAALVFAFTFGASEVPLVVGSTYPPALPLLAQRLFMDPDIASRPQAFALALLVTSIGLGVVVSCYGASRLAARRTGVRR